VPVLSVRRAPSALTAAIGRLRLDSALNTALSHAAPDGARTTSCLIVETRGNRLYAYQPERPVTPASTRKLFTAVAALGLGGDTRLVTELRARSAPSAGTLAGDLWFVGGGDPLLDTDAYRRTFEPPLEQTSHLEDLADQVVKAGITTISGAIVGDDRRYDQERQIASWKPSYQATGQVGPLTALTVDDGFTEVTEKGVRRAAADPAIGAAGVLVRLLTDRGVTVLGGTRRPTQLERPATTEAPTVIGSLPSLTINGLVHEMLEHSDNTTAELLLKEVGLASGGGGTTAAGLSALRAAVKGIGLPADELVDVDGSGLDRGNQVTCALLAGVVASQPPDGPVLSGLPVAGETGTLRRRMTDAKGKVRAKTGTLNGVSALAGVATDRRGARIDFALVLNGLSSTANGVEVGDEVARILTRFPDAPDADALSP
jgi:serine-type D-Ala-D-Ala carboxypeptidase/endopeptidase (penicillin-binding protein 4)